MVGESVSLWYFLSILQEWSLSLGFKQMILCAILYAQLSELDRRMCIFHWKVLSEDLSAPNPH